MGAVCICTLLISFCSHSPECRVSQKNVPLTHTPTQNIQARINSFHLMYAFLSSSRGQGTLGLLASGQQELNDSGWLGSHSCFMDLVLPGHRRWKVAVSQEMLGGVGGCLVLFYSCSVLWKDRVSPFHISSLFLNWYERCVSLKFSDSMGGKIPTIICHRMKICTYCKGSMSDTDHDLFLDSVLPIASCLRVFEGGGWEARNSSAI